MDEVQRDKDCIGHFLVFGLLDAFLKQSVGNTVTCGQVPYT